MPGGAVAGLNASWFAATSGAVLPRVARPASALTAAEDPSERRPSMLTAPTVAERALASGTAESTRSTVA